MSVSTLKLIVSAAIIAGAVFIVIAQCFILRKAEKHWWFGLIPIWAEMQIFGICWKKRYAIFYLVGEFLIMVFVQMCQFVITTPSMIRGLLNTTVLFTVLFVTSVYYVVAIEMSVRLACKFGQSEMFGIGCALLPFLFLPILAFGPATYHKGAVFASPFADSEALTQKKR